MMKRDELIEQLKQRFGLDAIHLNREVTLEVPADRLHEICLSLKNDLQFNQLIDVAGVDYLKYGLSEWITDDATEAGFERGVTDQDVRIIPWNKPRFAVVYHLLSIPHNQRLRLKVFFPNEAELIIASVTDVWPAANWFEREAFDLFGILFDGHPDLRRILTDYGFIGHPFRKDFPLWGKTEVRYDAAQQRVIYEPVQIAERVLVPKVIRLDNRYLESEGETTHA